MAVVLSDKERAARIRQVASLYDNVARQLTLLSKREEELYTSGSSPASVSTEIAALLVDVGTWVDELEAMSAAISMRHQTIIRKGVPNSLTRFRVINAHNFDTFRDRDYTTAAIVEPIDVTTPDSALAVDWSGIFLSGDIVDIRSGTADMLGSFYVAAVANTIIHTNEFIDNGTFASDTVWTKGTDWSIAAGVASHVNGTGSDLTMPNASFLETLAAGWYILEFTLSAWTAGTLTVSFSNGVGTSAHLMTLTNSGNGSYVLCVLSGNTSADLDFTASADFAGSIDNVSMRALLGIGVFDPEDVVTADSEVEDMIITVRDK